MGAISFQDVVPMPYDRIYSHDYHGWRDTMADVLRGCNAFTAAAGELLTEVSFFTAADSVAYTVRVWDGFIDGQLQDQLAATSGWLEFTGFHTVTLPAPVLLEEGDDFYLELEVDRGGQAFDRTSDVPVLLGAQYRTIVESSAAAGESWYWTGGHWEDLQTYDLGPWTGTANFCIKGCAVTAGLAVTPQTGLRADGPVGGPFSPTSQEFTLHNAGPGEAVYEVSTLPSVAWLDLVGDATGTLQAGESATVTVALNGVANELEAGAHVADIRFQNLSSGLGDCTRPVVLAVGEPQVQHAWTLDTDPGWTTESQWAFGQPTGGGGQYGSPDPTSGHTGANVYGFNLDGDYPNNLPPVALTTTAIDCSGLWGVQLRFWRWLGVEQPSYDQAALAVSNDGVAWTTVWSNPAEITDSAWTQVSYDISATADDQNAVHVRWIMGPTDVGWQYCGWNIDDIEILGLAPATVGVATDPDAAALAPAMAQLTGAWPNPFNPQVTLAYAVPSAGQVRLAVFDLRGRRVRTLVDAVQPAGPATVAWDGRDDAGRRVTSGTYVARLVADGRTDTRKLLLVK